MQPGSDPKSTSFHFSGSASFPDSQTRFRENCDQDGQPRRRKLFNTRLFFVRQRFRLTTLTTFIQLSNISAWVVRDETKFPCLVSALERVAKSLLTVALPTPSARRFC